MTGDEPDLTKQEKPWPGITEEDAITRLVAAIEGAPDEAARLAIIGVGNYAYLSQDWPALLDRANELLDDIEGTSQSKRWG
jgi:hypothetical protein